MSAAHDAIVVGARCAGSPTAMLLARKGYRVLVVDRATFPSDTVSTHVVHPLGVAALTVGASRSAGRDGCPPIHTYTFDFGPFTICGLAGHHGRAGRVLPAADRARQAARRRRGRGRRRGSRGVSPSRRSSIEDGRVVGIKGRSKGGEAVTERANVVIGADGRHSLVAEAVEPEQYNEKPPLLAAYYTYWSGLPMDGRFETYIRPHRGFAAAPTHDGLTLIGRRLAVRGVRGQQEGRRGQLPEDVRPRARVRRTHPRAPSAKRGSPARRCRTSSASRTAPAGRWSATRATTRTRSPRRASPTPSATPSSARRRSTRRSAARVRSTTRWASTSAARDEHVLPMYEFTCQLATLEPPPPEMQQLFGAIHGNQQAMDGFAQMNAGTISPAAVSSPGKRRRDHAGGANRELNPIVGLERAS